MTGRQPTREQVIRALRTNDIDIEQPVRWRLYEGGDLAVQLDEDGGIVLARRDWAPSRLCSGSAECVGADLCPRRSPCHE